MRATLLALVLCGVVIGSPKDAPVDDFQQRLEDYVKIRKDATDKVPQLQKKAEPEQILQRELALGEAIRKARPRAQAGDILTPEVAPVLRQILKSTFSGERKTDMKASVKEGNPKHEKAPGEVEPVLKVNEVYPKNAPLSTVPPTILARLPKLPKDLEYRFVGRTLILRDRDSNLIVDFMKDAVPAL
jgi:hypothetical protein